MKLRRNFAFRHPRYVIFLIECLLCLHTDYRPAMKFYYWIQYKKKHLWSEIFQKSKKKFFLDIFQTDNRFTYSFPSPLDLLIWNRLATSFMDIWNIFWIPIHLISRNRKKSRVYPNLLPTVIGRFVTRLQSVISRMVIFWNHRAVINALKNFLFISNDSFI